MSSMSQQFPEDQDQHSNKTVAHFMVCCDSEGRVTFDYDWEEGDLGASGMSSILSVLDIENLSGSVIQDMKEKATSAEELESLKNIEIIFNAIRSFKNQSAKNSAEEIVVDPIDVISLL